MDFRLYRDNSGNGTEKNDSDTPQAGMDRYRKKLVSEVGLMGLRSRKGRLEAGGSVSEKTVR